MPESEVDQSVTTLTGERIARLPAVSLTEVTQWLHSPNSD